jgi:hypothetical protein
MYCYFLENSCDNTLTNGKELPLSVYMFGGGLCVYRFRQPSTHNEVTSLKHYGYWYHPFSTPRTIFSRGREREQNTLLTSSINSTNCDVRTVRILTMVSRHFPRKVFKFETFFFCEGRDPCVGCLVSASQPSLVDGVPLRPTHLPPTYIKLRDEVFDTKDRVRPTKRIRIWQILALWAGDLRDGLLSGPSSVYAISTSYAQVMGVTRTGASRPKKNCRGVKSGYESASICLSLLCCCALVLYVWPLTCHYSFLLTSWGKAQ